MNAPSPNHFNLQPIPQLFRLLALSGLLVAPLLAAPAYACGGCFSPPTPEVTQTVVQNAERVLFLHDPATQISNVWVEVRYSGQAKDFGWVLPVPKLPKVSVGSVAVFDALDQAMAMRYDVQQQPAENCRSAFDGCVEPYYGYQYGPGAEDAAASDASADGASNGGGGPKVQILSQGSTGPYDYVVVQSTDAKALYDWLTGHGYALPDKAKPIIQSHIDQGNVFVAVHLQNGQGVEAIRPIALQMLDSDPCVPLRLTSIAAADELSVVVTIAGAGRAVPKNHLAVEPNPLRMTLGQMTSGAGSVPRPINFDQVVAGAIDEAGGRAFVTESAMDGATVSQFLSNNPFKGLESAFAAVTNLDDFAQILANLPLNAELADTLGPLLKFDAVLPGVPTLQALADLKSCALYWYMPASPACALPGVVTPLTHEALAAIAVDGAALAKAVDDDLVKPIGDVMVQLAASQTITRLAMRSSPNEMDRDPIFAFNPDLPGVSPSRPVQTHAVCSTGWWDDSPGGYYYGAGNADSVRYTIDGLGSWVFPAGTQPPQDARFKSAPLALTVQVLEESGKPIDIAATDVPVVSAAIAGAKPGKSSLPADLVLQKGKSWLPPPSDVLVEKVTPWTKPTPQNYYNNYTCTPKACWVDGQLPPDVSGQACSADADASDGGGLSDAGPDVKTGPVPGVDSANGWVEPDAGNGGVAGADGSGSAKSGCAATQHGSASLASALLTLLACLAVRRRRV